jgi:hypothetical protein
MNTYSFVALGAHGEARHKLPEWREAAGDPGESRLEEGMIWSQRLSIDDGGSLRMSIVGEKLFRGADDVVFAAVQILVTFTPYPVLRKRRAVNRQPYATFQSGWFY